MSGVQGARPPEYETPTTYESVAGGENRTKTDIRSKEDQGPIQIDKQQDKIEDFIAAASQDDPVLDADKDDKKPDLGVTGTG
ncbi:hypothetical protein HS088_TW21G00297 [Tripterygium wilfordii]|uniref:Uncharacterized protein n=1 Tax=Tripterygium wilfordii TaxID=458696 RepID=A0A7J7C1X8_TRIWF|nr:uncharacterized protein LOC119988368 [Tripterygium wilfordii]XP_038689312.1 uncharacterized protein LOC119988369 [Tripterygium wilfordii]KAF5728133.1 hypothetical protein HS088_TW21G00276 [Tripterygium wilfordii]KAF5728154.1 hypothetical protein HS088_TW21G00297 [Tripterygium wilfordii]